MERKIIMDGTNVAYEETDEGGEPKLATLLAVRCRRQDLGYDPVIVVNVTLRHAIDDAAQDETREDEGVIK